MILSWAMTLAAAGLGLLVLALVVLVILRFWVRSLARTVTAHVVEDLARRQDSLEELLTSLAEKGVEQPPSAVQFDDGRGRLSPKPPTRSLRPDPAASSTFKGPTLIAVPSLAVASSSATATMLAELSQRFGEIWRQADAGASVEAIAEQTGYPIGEVELILGLRRQLASEHSRPREPSL
jgi:hypothetical protein